MSNEKRSLEQAPPRPYPRKCAECGEVAVEQKVIPYDAEVKHDGKLHKFHIDHLVIDQCSHCGEQYFTNDTDDQISSGLRLHVGLLQPDEIRQQLELLGLTQREFAEHLRVAQESVSRWLTGAAIQSRSLDTLMRLYFRLPSVREELKQPGTLATPAADASKDHMAVGQRVWFVATERPTTSGPLPSWSTTRLQAEAWARRESFLLISSN